MLNNPERASRGGDVEGTCPIDVTQGDAIEVAKASFDPGYDLGESLGDLTQADMIRGYATYGRAVGNKSRV